jgi:hypothetical protein
LRSNAHESANWVELYLMAPALYYYIVELIRGIESALIQRERHIVLLNFVADATAIELCCLLCLIERVKRSLHPIKTNRVLPRMSIEDHATMCKIIIKKAQTQ